MPIGGIPMMDPRQAQAAMLLQSAGNFFGGDYGADSFGAGVSGIGAGLLQLNQILQRQALLQHQLAQDEERLSLDRRRADAYERSSESLIEERRRPNAAEIGQQQLRGTRSRLIRELKDDDSELSRRARDLGLSLTPRAIRAMDEVELRDTIGTLTGVDDNDGSYTLLTPEEGGNSFFMDPSSGRRVDAGVRQRSSSPFNQLGIPSADSLADDVEAEIDRMIRAAMFAPGASKEDQLRLFAGSRGDETVRAQFRDSARRMVESRIAQGAGMASSLGRGGGAPSPDNAPSPGEDSRIEIPPITSSQREAIRSVVDARGADAAIRSLVATGRFTEEQARAIVAQLGG